MSLNINNLKNMRAMVRYSVIAVSVLVILMGAMWFVAHQTRSASAEDADVIRTIEDLAGIPTSASGAYSLANDLDFNDCASYANCDNMTQYTTGTGWTPIAQFSGVFLGNGYTIANLYINNPSSNLQGLFGSINSSGRITDLGVVQADVTGDENVGIITGYLSGRVERVFATGDVNGYDSVGAISGSAQNANVYNVYAIADVSGDRRVAGLIGFLQLTTITNAYSAGPVTANTWSGGALGIVGTGTIVTAVFNNAHVSGLPCASPDAEQPTECRDQTTANLTTANTIYTNYSWNFTTVWQRDNAVNGGYPTLRAPQDHRPIVSDITITDITATTATFNGVTAPSAPSATILIERGFEYGTVNGYDSLANEDYLDGLPLGAYSAQITDLECGTEYLVRGIAVGMRDSDSDRRTGLSAPVSFTTAACAAAPTAENDKNGDGVADNEQVNVAVLSSLTENTVALEVDSTCELDSSQMIAEADNNAADNGFTYEHGLVGFEATCGAVGFTTTVTQYYYDVDPEGLVLRKYMPTSGTYVAIPGATITTDTVYGTNVTVASFELQDGGPLDADGVANGVIVDPAGLASAVAATNGGVTPGVPNTGIGSTATTATAPQAFNTFVAVLAVLGAVIAGGYVALRFARR